MEGRNNRLAISRKQTLHQSSRELPIDLESIESRI